MPSREQTRTAERKRHSHTKDSYSQHIWCGKARKAIMAVQLCTSGENRTVKLHDTSGATLYLSGHDSGRR